MRLARPETNVDGMHQDVWPYLFNLDNTWRKITGHGITIYSARDGIHSATSDHYWGGGIDLRTWTTPDSAIQLSSDRRKRLLGATRIALGDNWYVEDEGDHFHLSYRPRTPKQYGDYTNV